MATLTEQFYLRYWGGLLDYMNDRGLLSVPRQAYKEARQLIYEWKNGTTDIRIAAGISIKEHWIHVGLTLIDPKDERSSSSGAKVLFLKLQTEQGEIRKAINADGGKWLWELRSNEPESWIILRKYSGFDHEYEWQTHYVWLAETLKAFREQFELRTEVQDK